MHSMATDHHDDILHLSPVWRDRADFIIAAPVDRTGLDARFEQLWGRREDDRRFELCCIPFFLYDVALGDHVETEPVRGREYVVARVVESAGGYTFRAWFGDSSSSTAREELVDTLQRRGFLFEWHSAKLVAIHAEDSVRATELADHLAARQREGKLAYETGRT